MNLSLRIYYRMKSEMQSGEIYLKSLIGQGENQHLDFKFEISDAKKIARTFSAFANTGGGKLLIGVKDNGRISGIRTDEEIYMADSAARMYSRPEVGFHIKKWHVEGRAILEIDIPPSEKRPHYARNDAGEWTAYVRVGDQNMQANRILVNYWKGEGNSRAVMLNYGREEKILMSYLAEFDKITLSKFMRIARTGRSEAENILVDMMLLKVIDMEITERAVFYRLNPIQS